MKRIPFIIILFGIISAIIYCGCNPEDPPDSLIYEEPVADAGEDRIVELGSLVELNGAASHDPDGGNLVSYHWWMIEKPQGSAAWDNVEGERVEFVADMIGDYFINLEVTDDEGDKGIDGILITTYDLNAPIADAGNDIMIDVSDTATLDGSDSHDPNSRPFSYWWTLVSKPQYSNTVLWNRTSENPIIIIDEPGEYKIALEVKNDIQLTDSDTVYIHNNPPELSSFSPVSGQPGTPVKLFGKNFSSHLSGNDVRFNSELATIHSATHDLITAFVPANATTGPIEVMLLETDETAQSAEDFTIPVVTSWIEVDCPTNTNLYAIDFVSQDLGIIVGHGGTVLRSDDGGETWNMASVNTGMALRDVHMFDESEGILCGGAGLFKTTNGGNSWQRLDSPANSDLSSMSFPEPGIGYAVGSGNAFWKILDRGDSIAVLSGPGTPYNDLQSVSFPTPEIGTIVGEDRTIFRTEDGGLTWTDQSGAATIVGTTNEVLFLDEWHGIISCGGVPGLQETYILHTLNGGNTWSLADSPPAMVSFQGIYLGHEGFGYIVGSSGMIVQTSDGGLNWSQDNSGTSYQLYDVDKVEEAKYIAVGIGGTIIKRQLD